MKIKQEQYIFERCYVNNFCKGTNIRYFWFYTLSCQISRLVRKQHFCRSLPATRAISIEQGLSIPRKPSNIDLLAFVPATIEDGHLVYIRHQI
jgi:hypothetical protein